MRILNRKTVVATATAGLVVIGAGAAYAYWSTSGSSTGSATSATGTANLAIAQTSTISNMYPGDTAQTISGTVTNNAANAAYVSKVTVSIKDVTPAVGAAGSCDASDYTLASPDMTVGKDLVSGEIFTFTGATIKFNDKGTNQDGCKGAKVNLAYAAS